jgi:hypothetical protein
MDLSSHINSFHSQKLRDSLLRVFGVQKIQIIHAVIWDQVVEKLAVEAPEAKSSPEGLLQVLKFLVEKMDKEDVVNAMNAWNEYVAKVNATKYFVESLSKEK